MILRRSYRPAAGIAALVVSLLAAFAGGGCETVPARDFATYKDAFAQARTAGEEVLLDYGAAKEQHARLQSDREEAGLRAEAARRGITVAELRDERDEAALLRFSAEGVVAVEQAEDEVGVRMRAWAVVATYNDVLTKLAEGRPASEVESALDGLVQALSGLPVDAVQSALTAVSPVVPDVKQIVALVRRHLEVKEFNEAVRAASPLMREFFKLLRKDADNFYNVRFALYQVELKEHRDTARGLQQSAVPLLVAFADPPSSGDPPATQAAGPDTPTDDRRLVAEVNTALSRFHRWNRQYLLAVPNRPAGARRDPAVQAQLQDLEGQIKAVADRADAARARMYAYKEVLTNYVRLVNELERRVTALEQASAEGPRGLPPVLDLLRLAVNVRRAVTAYENAKTTE